MIDLRSDTVTRPCPAMRKAMYEAEVGDDVYGEDPTVRELEELTAQILGKQAALFAPSGTQSNLLALLAHCERGDEYIVGQQAHTYKFEGGGAAVLGSIQPQPLSMAGDGTLALNDIKSAIKPDDFHFAQTRLVCLENTHAGCPLPADYPASVAALCRSHNLALHLDGARLFNASIDQGISAADLVSPYDSVSVCLSKGLGAPVGSVLVGDQAFIHRARRWRKVLGGGMRQAGILAAAGIFALQHNIDRLAEDHAHAQQIAHALGQRFGHRQIRLATNMIHLDLPDSIYQALRQHLQSSGITAGRARWVVHLDIDQSAINRIRDAVGKLRHASVMSARQGRIRESGTRSECGHRLHASSQRHCPAACLGHGHRCIQW